MKIHDFLNKTEDQPVNAQFADQLEEKYDAKLTEYIKKLLSTSSEGIFLRVMIFFGSCRIMKF